jgi:hypothetical protein
MKGSLSDNLTTEAIPIESLPADLTIPSPLREKISPNPKPPNNSRQRFVLVKKLYCRASRARDRCSPDFQYFAYDKIPGFKFKDLYWEVYRDGRPLRSMRMELWRAEKWFFDNRIFTNVRHRSVTPLRLEGQVYLNRPNIKDGKPFEVYFYMRFVKK